MVQTEQMKTREAEAKLASFTGTLQQRLLQLATEVSLFGPLTLTGAAEADAPALIGTVRLISVTMLLASAQRSCLALTVSTARCEQVEARGNALEGLREENEGLTTDYNHLRERLSAKGG